jgi:hypothetical protein
VSEGEWKDAPAWVVETAVHEKWGEKEWGHLELLRVRFDELGVELQPGGNPPTDLRDVFAYRKGGGFVAAVQLNRAHQTPLHEALHDLVNQVARSMEEK